MHTGVIIMQKDLKVFEVPVTYSAGKWTPTQLKSQIVRENFHLQRASDVGCGVRCGGPVENRASSTTYVLCELKRGEEWFAKLFSFLVCGTFSQSRRREKTLL